MKKILSLVLAVLMLSTMLPMSALAAYDATKPACQVPGHEKFDGQDHNRPQSCWVKGHFGCDGMNHERAACGKWGHFNCDGKAHGASECGAEGHFVCDTLTHGQAACGLENHCVTDGKRHIAAVCGIEGHLDCDGLKHKVASCGLSGHMGCDGADHSKAVCGKAGHYVCDGAEHAKPVCGRYGHCISDGKDHEAAPCGHAGHYACDGRKHELAACGVEGHFACEVRAHLHKPVSKYCNAVPQHMVCQGDEMHYCDPAQGGCGKEYLCSRSNAHTACRMCGLLWCDRTLGGHETPCNNAYHRPCYYRLTGKKYVKDEHQICYWCGEAKCNGKVHGAGFCVDTCDACGEGKRFHKRHVFECGHHNCIPSRERHERCPIEGCNLWMCDSHSHFEP
ncbi:MAG: hypothetical protein IJB85_10935 [Clostridia bacterium]|nr:hypothetical protein [Clostridia bacterium]